MAHRARKTFDPNVKLSKKLSYLLRHGAEKEGYNILPGGFLYVEDILKNPKFSDASVEKIREIVENNDKQRFALEDDENSGKLKIRANQGHTIEVEDLQLTPITSADDFPVVIHGTYHKAFQFIAKQGLSRMKRNHIHFAAGFPGEDGVISGMRQNCSVIIQLDLQKALEDGFQFSVSANNVILCPGNEDGFIPTKYFSKVTDRESGQKNVLIPVLDGSVVLRSGQVQTRSPVGTSTVTFIRTSPGLDSILPFAILCASEVK